MLIRITSFRKTIILSYYAMYGRRRKRRRRTGEERNDEKMISEENLRIWPGPGLAA